MTKKTLFWPNKPLFWSKKQLFGSKKDKKLAKKDVHPASVSQPAIILKHLKNSRCGSPAVGSIIATSSIRFVFFLIFADLRCSLVRTCVFLNPCTSLVPVRCAPRSSSVQHRHGVTADARPSLSARERAIVPFYLVPLNHSYSLLTLFSCPFPLDGCTHFCPFFVQF